MERVDVGKYIVIDPEFCHGQMTFKGKARVRGGHRPDVSRQGLLGRCITAQLAGAISPWAIEEAISLASQSLQARYAPYLSAAAALSQHAYSVTS